jgi:integrase/recombinase XerD
MNLASRALRFLFRVTLGPTGIGDHLARIPTPERSWLWPAGLGAHLKVADIDSARMLIRVEQSKGRKDRYVMPRRSSSICCGNRGG